MGSPSVSPTSTMVDWADSHYEYVKQRILAINSTRVFSGIVSASDWPSKEFNPETYYMIVSTEDPNKGQGPGTNSWTAPLFGMRIQWVWGIIGTDIPSNAFATNRGDRYRKHLAMIQEVTQGMFPGFCEKQQLSIQGTTPVWTSYVPKEMIWFRKPEFSERIDRQTGIMFGSAVTTITSFAPNILG